MGFWQKVKDGFAYGLGGGLGARIGYEIGDFVVTWVKRFVLFIFAGGAAASLTMCMDNPFAKYVDQQPAKVMKQQQHQQR